MKNTFNPFDDSKTLLVNFRRQMIMRHPTFCCPISKEILDYKASHIVKFKTPNGEIKTDVISHNGWKKLPSDIKERASMTIIENFEEL